MACLTSISVIFLYHLFPLLDSSCNKPVSAPVSVPKGVAVVDPPERVLCGPEGVHRGRGELVLEESGKNYKVNA